MATVTEKRAAFRALHQLGCFVLPNPWDVGSARMFARLGFKALASTSSGFAWTQGRPDSGVALDGVIEHLGELCAGVDLPVNADFQSGFAETPEGVAASVGRAIAAGVAGFSIEDRTTEGGPLYDLTVARERLRAARRAIDTSGADVCLVARTELLFDDANLVSEAIGKLVAFAEDGADCLYAPGVRKLEDIAAMARAVAPKPLNVLALDPALTLAQYADLGVRRVSVGGGLARVGWGAAVAAARQMHAGSFAALAQAMPGRELDEAFAADEAAGPYLRNG